jgi:hypothetical protein
MTFYEIIDGLINVDAVPESNRRGKGYDDARKEIHEEISVPNDVQAVCYHEAAHWIYAEFLGFELELSEDDLALIKPVGLRITYYPSDDKPGRYEAIVSAIAIPIIRTTSYTERVVKLLARVAVAGGESTNHFFKSHKRGDTEDLAMFEQRYKTARLMLTDIPIPSDYLADARLYVQTDLRRDEFIEQVHEKAEQVRQECFPLVSYTKVSL